jgi:unsaturated rhamnogalacturonyl hydrolase
VTQDGKPIMSQVVRLGGGNEPDELVFQADFAPGQTREFEVKAGMAQAPAASKVYGRYVPERLDDFAWENDRIAFRVYGPALEKTTKPGPASSGIDVWCKRTRNMIIDKWYKESEDSYHKDRGEGLDGYKVGHGRGAGGTGIWKDGKLYTTGIGGWRTQKVLANGPVRLVFQLTYDPIDVDGKKLAETRRITLDGGTNLNMIQSTWTLEGGGEMPIEIAAGLSKHDDRPGESAIHKDQGWIRYWDASDRTDKTDNGNIGTGVIMIPDQVVDVKDQKDEILIIGKAETGKPFTYWAGAGWDKSGDFQNVQDWDKYLEQAAKRAASPLKVSVSP